MTTGRLLATLIALAVATSVAGGCRRRAPRVAIAEITEIRGVVVIEDGQGGSRKVEGRVSLLPGERVKTGPGTRVVIRFPDGRIVRVAENAEMRMLVGPGDAASRLEVMLGKVQVEAGATALHVATARGMARIEPGGAMNIDARGERSRYEIVLGAAVLMDAAGELTLGPGDGIEIVIADASIERYRVQVGGAVVEPIPPAVQSVPVQEPAPSEAPLEAAVDPEGEGEPEPAVRELGETDVRVVAGESAVIHDGRGNVRVALAPKAACDGPVEAQIVRAENKRAKISATTAKGGASAVLRAGHYRYRVRCRGEAWRGGTLAVRRDRATAPVPRYPPNNSLDADGRRYTILYQSRLPALRLSWPEAPADGGPFELSLATPVGTLTETADAAVVELPSGAVPEGVHRFSFTAKGKKKIKAPETVVELRFDNAATSAQILEPRATAASAKLVAGVALEGSRVSVDGQEIAIDKQGRFRGELTKGATRALAVRIDHPRNGVHYYIRRLAAAPVASTR